MPLPFGLVISMRRPRCTFARRRTITMASTVVVLILALISIAEGFNKNSPFGFRELIKRDGSSFSVTFPSVYASFLSLNAL